MNTVGQPPESIDIILENSDPNYMHLELDIAHALQGGGDPAAIIRKHAKRLLFLHFKDVSGPTTPTGYEFCELGKGRVDLPAVFDALKAIKFRGWGIVELDRVPHGSTLSPKEANALSLHLLREKYGVKL
jgi:inosose dehydratase